MKQSNKILFFGNERLATGIRTRNPIVNALLSNGYPIAAIAVPSSLKSNSSPALSRKPRVLEIADFAKTNSIPLLEIENIKTAAETLRSFDASIGILAAFGKLIPQEIIDIFPKGIVNIHPSLLPLHRGPIPIEAVILSGEDKTGVSIMKLVKQMDAGPIYDQSVLQLNGNESKQELADLLGELAAKRLVEILPSILSGQLNPAPQDTNIVPTYDIRLRPDQGKLDFSKTAVELEREVRAFQGWPRSRTEINNRPVVIIAVHVKPFSEATKPGIFLNHNHELAFTTKEGLLIIDRLIPYAGKEMSGADYLRGYGV
jgi:methionyl-tRNA formyltransferase